MKQFDFNHSDFLKQSSQRRSFLLMNFNKPITEEEFVKEGRSWLRKEKNNQSRKPSKLRNQYSNLKLKFGFFTDHPSIKN